MSTRPTLRPQAVIVNGDMSLASLTSTPTILGGLTVGSYTYSWTGSSPIGIVQLQISNDYALNTNGTVANAGTWTTVYFNYQGSIVNNAPVSGNTGTGALEWTTGCYAIRTIYTKTSGTGTIQAVINGKVA